MVLYIYRLCIWLTILHLLFSQQLLSYGNISNISAKRHGFAPRAFQSMSYLSLQLLWTGSHSLAHPQPMQRPQQGRQVRQRNPQLTKGSNQKPASMKCIKEENHLTSSLIHSYRKHIHRAGYRFNAFLHLWEFKSLALHLLCHLTEAKADVRLEGRQRQAKGKMTAVQYWNISSNIRTSAKLLPMKKYKD